MMMYLLVLKVIIVPIYLSVALICLFQNNSVAVSLLSFGKPYYGICRFDIKKLHQGELPICSKKCLPEIFAGKPFQLRL